MKLSHLLFFIPFLFSACTSSVEPIPIKIDRFEQTLFSLPTDSTAISPPALQQLQTDYPNLLPAYSQSLGIPQPNHPLYQQVIADFITDSVMLQSYQRVQEVFPNLQAEEQALSQAWGYYAKLFNTQSIPKLCTVISGFNQSILIADSLIAIALDKYLSPSEPMYELLEMPLYLRHNTQAKYIPSDALKAWLYTEYPPAPSDESVLDAMLYEAKILYATKQCFPSIHDSTLFNYTPTQYQFCHDNEALIWQYIVERKLLYRTDNLSIQKLTGQAPFTSLLGKEVPGRAAVYIAYRILEAYQKRNNEPLAQLINNTNYQQILNLSKYRP